mmetsp:Transcript_16106/g.23305  ORF Transcript_16106/g.23305 Transcript_16106/m.23305 type:complete len:123 (+) Transcript_16106:769-1137(+)
MGNILVSQATLEKLKREDEKAQNLLSITPINSKERELIDQANTERKFKVYGSVVLAISFAASIKRYFPNTLITENPKLYGLATISIVLPLYSIMKMVTNREVVRKLEVIRENHALMGRLPPK